MSYNAFIKQDAHGSESGNKAMSRTSMGCNLHGDRYGSPNYSVSYSRTQPLINIGISLAGFCEYWGVNIKKVQSNLVVMGKFIFLIAFFAFSMLGILNAVPTASEYMDSIPRFSNTRFEFGISNLYESNKVVVPLFATGPAIDMLNGTAQISGILSNYF